MDKPIVGENFKSCQLPKYVKPYWPLIKACLNPQLERAYQTYSCHIDSYLDISNGPSDIGKIYYLTIQESWVEPGDSQRRPGLHVDIPGKVKLKKRVLILDQIMRVLVNHSAMMDTIGVMAVLIM